MLCLLKSTWRGNWKSKKYLKVKNCQFRNTFNYIFQYETEIMHSIIYIFCVLFRFELVSYCKYQTLHVHCHKLNFYDFSSWCCFLRKSKIKSWASTQKLYVTHRESHRYVLPTVWTLLFYYISHLAG